MAKKDDTKMRVLAVERILREGKMVSSARILRLLSLRYDIHADRKTIYDDIYAINRFIPVDAVPGKGGRLSNRRCDRRMRKWQMKSG